MCTYITKWFCYPRLQPPLLTQGSNQAILQPNEVSREQSIALPGASVAAGESGGEKVGYCLSKEQTIQLQTQIQQVHVNNVRGHFSLQH